MNIASLMLPIVLSLAPFAQAEPDGMQLSQQGQMFSVQIALGEPIKIFVVGREEAKIDLSELKVSIRQLTPSPQNVLGVEQAGNFFTVSGLDLKKPTNLEVKTKVGNKEETFRFQLDNSLR